MYYPIDKDFLEKVHSRYDEAIKGGFMQFNGEHVKHELVHVPVGDGKDIAFQYSTIYSLKHRPEKGDIKKNPFEDPEPELTIVEDYGDENQFRIVFNKFPTVAHHIMIITKNFKPQTTPLSPDELLASYSLLRELQTSDKNHQWFGFYNCGEDSGASQPHKHIQFMTLPADFTPFPDLIVNESEAYIPSYNREPLQSPDLPMAHFIAKLPDLLLLNEEDLVMYFSSLLQRVLTVARDNDSKSISFNVIMTTTYIMLVPRSNGTYKDIGINSCAILGLFLFKNDELCNIVKEDTPLKVWESVGFPNTAGQSSNEYHY